jgi:RNA polymerase sigma-70 factor (ECF subfamily)
MSGRPDDTEAGLQSTASLIELARAGDDAARERLFARVLPVLRRWAHRRVPAKLRHLHETDDFVQVALLRAFQRLETFDARGPGALLGYLRAVLLNVVRDELRRAAARPAGMPWEGDLPSADRSVLEEVAGRETIERYERALARLAPDRQEVVILRVEMDLSYPEIADLAGLPSANAARMQVARSLVALAEAMREHA